MDSIYESLTELEKTGLTLRDFFNSHDSHSLKSAYVRLNPSAAVNLTDRAWLEAEYDFNALFVGPGKLLAAPFASVYLEDDALVMGKATLEIRSLWQRWDYRLIRRAIFLTIIFPACWS